MATPKTRVLILGGGFGGIYAAMQLDKTLAKDPNVEITIVNRDNFLLFTPMLHEVAASDLDITDIVCPLRSLLKRVHVFIGDVESIDFEDKRAIVRHGYDGHTHALTYDYCLIALGSTTNFFKLPGVQENSVTVKSLGDAIHLRNRLIAHLEEADTECAAADREPLLTFVCAGGGFAGIETIASMHDFVHQSLRYYPNVPKEKIRMIIVHPGKTILPELGEELGSYAQKKLIDRGVEILSGARVASASADGVTLTDGTFIRTRTLMWTAGTTPHPIISTLPCKTDKGKICTNEFMEVQGRPGIWALGDCANIPDLKTGKPFPPTAQHAIREGIVAAKNITAAIRGGKKRAFTFTTIGLLASLGRRTGVAKILGLKFSGFLAWWMWRTIYLSKLPGLDRKVRVAIHWTLDVLFSKDFVQFQTIHAPSLSGHESGAAATIESTPRACSRHDAVAMAGVNA